VPLSYESNFFRHSSLSNLCSLITEATAFLTLVSDTDYNLSEPKKIAEAKIVNPQQVKRRSVRNDRIFSRSLPVTSLPDLQMILVLFKNYWNYRTFVLNLRTDELPFKIPSC